MLLTKLLFEEVFFTVLPVINGAGAGAVGTGASKEGTKGFTGVVVVVTAGVVGFLIVLELPPPPPLLGIVIGRVTGGV